MFKCNSKQLFLFRGDLLRKVINFFFLVKKKYLLYFLVNFQKYFVIPYIICFVIFLGWQ